MADFNKRIELLEAKSKRAKMKIEYITMSEKTYRRFLGMLPSTVLLSIRISDELGTIRGHTIKIDNDLPKYRIDSVYMEGLAQ